MIVATAGHIDHGKTTLVRMLTGVDTDRLPEEKKRGISIDLGFAYWKPGGGEMIGFVDVPGHQRFIRNMLAGVCCIDYMMLVVAADDGVMPQTIEHLHIVDLLDVRRGVVVITKIDRVAPERVNQVRASVRGLLAATGFASLPVLPVSAASGSGIAALRDELVAAASIRGQRAYQHQHCRYAIDRAFTVSGSGTVVTGTVFNGAVAVGDRLVLAPFGTQVRVRALQKQGEPAQQAVAGERCALNLGGVSLDRVGRGDWVVAPALTTPTQRFDVRLRVLASETRPLEHWTPVHLHMGAADVSARIAIKRGAALAPGAAARVQLITDRPLSVLHGDRFVVRDQSALRTLGGGSVIDPFAPATRRHTPARLAELVALEDTHAGAAFAALLACSPAGVDLARFGRTFNFVPEWVAGLALQTDAIVVGSKPRIALRRAVVDALRQQILETLALFHQESPRTPGADVGSLREALAPKLPQAVFAALLRGLADEHKIEVSGSTARLPQHVSTANSVDEAIWRSVNPILDAAGLHVPPLRELAVAAKLEEAALRDFLRRQSRTGEVIRVTSERYCLRATLAQLAALAHAVAQSVPDGRFTAARFRDRSGVGRNVAIEFLECLDRLGITLRVGDSRKMSNNFVPVPTEATVPPATVASLEAVPGSGPRLLSHRVRR